MDQAKKTYDLDPTMVAGQNWMCRSYNAKGMYAQSLAISEKTLQTSFPFFNDVSYAYAKTDRRQEAETMINKWKEREKTGYIMNYWVASCYAALGEKEAALSNLKKLIGLTIGFCSESKPTRLWIRCVTIRDSKIWYIVSVCRNS